MLEAIFLSASVPDPIREPQYAATAEPVAIASAVSALIHVTMGRRPLIWGGHPAITPMIWVVAQDLGVEYAEWVHLYQSRYFEDMFPQENARFQNVTYVDSIDHDRDQSLVAMRTRMLSEHTFAAAVFIGGMSGILDELQLFQHLQPSAALVPVVSTGGAAIDVAGRLSSVYEDLNEDLDYVAVLHRHLGISPRERRFVRPTDQPPAVADRYWQPSTPRT